MEWPGPLVGKFTEIPKLLTFEAVYPFWHAAFDATGERVSSAQLPCNCTGDCLVFLVHFYIRPDKIDDFEKLLVAEAREVRALERGCLRFDLLRAVGPTAAGAAALGHARYLIVEAVESAAALAEHAAMPHYLHVRAALPELQALPRSHDRGYRIVAPCSLGAWRTHEGDPDDPRPYAHLQRRSGEDAGRI